LGNNAGYTTLDDSAVMNNTATLGESGSPGGGGIYNFSGAVLLNDSTVRRNIPNNCIPTGSVTGCNG
jgi:hypothetical protein